jgi:hypothetical protein
VTPRRFDGNRLQANLSQGELAERVHGTQVDVGKIENRKLSPARDLLQSRDDAASTDWLLIRLVDQSRRRRAFRRGSGPWLDPLTAGPRRHGSYVALIDEIVFERSVDGMDLMANRAARFLDGPPKGARRVCVLGLLQRPSWRLHDGDYRRHRRGIRPDQKSGIRCLTTSPPSVVPGRGSYYARIRASRPKRS